MQNMETIKPKLEVQKLRHRNANWWGLKCDQKEPFNSIVKKVEGRRWSSTWNLWLIPQENRLSDELREQLYDQFEIRVLANESEKPDFENNKPNNQKEQSSFKIESKPNLRGQIETGRNGDKGIGQIKISKENQTALSDFNRELVLKGYSPTTLKTYSNEFRQFLETIKGVTAKDFTPDRIKDYLYYCATTLKLTEATLHSKINALKFYYEKVLGRERFFWEVPRPKKQMQLPKVISEEKILMGIEKLENIKHRALIMLAYSAGLRVSEVVNLKITSIQSDRMQILIHQSKGKKDRMVPLSKVLLHTLREYYKLYKPKDWLFEGQYSKKPISTRTAQAVFNQVYKKLGLPKGISFHSLRHSYATHLVENGIDVTFVQKLLGHNDVRTTMRYTHVSQAKINQIESPLDRAMRLKQEKQNELKQ